MTRRTQTESRWWGRRRTLMMPSRTLSTNITQTIQRFWTVDSGCLHHNAFTFSFMIINLICILYFYISWYLFDLVPLIKISYLTTFTIHFHVSVLTLLYNHVTPTSLSLLNKEDRLIIFITGCRARNVNIQIPSISIIFNQRVHSRDFYPV